METISFQPLKFRRLSEMIENSIKDLILAGELTTGQRLPTEKELGKQFGVSPVTVREALRALQAFGIIEKRRGKGGGIFVSVVKSEAVKDAMHSFLVSKNISVRDLGQLREIIQPPSAAMAASRITPTELKELEKNIQYCDNKIKKTERGASKRELLDIVERNIEFDRLIGEATHNPALALIIDNVLDFVMDFYRYISPNMKVGAKALDHHREILACLKQRDPIGAEKKMRAHLEWLGHYYISTVAQMRDGKNVKPEPVH